MAGIFTTDRHTHPNKVITFKQTEFFKEITAKGLFFYVEKYYTNYMFYCTSLSAKNAIYGRINSSDLCSSFLLTTSVPMTSCQ